jgi:peroxiredoxin
MADKIKLPRWFSRTLDIGLWVLVLGMLVWRFGPQVGAALGIGGGGGAPAPDFTVETLDGETIRLSELKGKVVLVNFWATWCPPCRLEMPGFQDVWEDYRDQDVVILGLSMDQGVRSEVASWVRSRGITYPVAFASGSIARSYGGARVLPTSVLIDREGRIAHTVEGFYAETTLRASIRRLLD